MHLLWLTFYKISNKLVEMRGGDDEFNVNLLLLRFS